MKKMKRLKKSTEETQSKKNVSPTPNYKLMTVLRLLETQKERHAN
jgi:hypothetical protein